MPSITNLKNIKPTSKLFEKKEYRPWSEKNQPLELSNKILNIEKKSLTYETDPSKLEKIWRGLYGAKKSLLGILLNSIEETHENHLITGVITTNQLVSDSALPVNTIKASIQQLKLDALISSYETKPGKGGFARYKVPKDIYKYFVEKYIPNM